MVLTIELADLAFSIDNVVVVVALSDELWIILFGVFMGILTMRFAAGIFTKLIAREPILKPAAYLVVFNIGVELLLAQFAHMEFARSGQVHHLGWHADPGSDLFPRETAAGGAPRAALDRRRGCPTSTSSRTGCMRPVTGSLGLLFQGIGAAGSSGRRQIASW